MIIEKNPTLKPSENGGYILSFEKCTPATDRYSSTSYLGMGEEVFTDGQKALDRMNAIKKNQDAAITGYKNKE